MEGKPGTVQRRGRAKRQRGNLQETALTLGKLPDPPADPYPNPYLDDPLASRLTEAVGKGLYPSVARLNHSCRPNCKLGFDEFGCCVVRVRPGIKVRMSGFARTIPMVLPTVPRGWSGPLVGTSVW